MLKNIALLLVLSIACVLLIHNFDLVHRAVLMTYASFVKFTSKLFADPHFASTIAKVSLLVLIPGAIGFGSKFIYQFVAKRELLYTSHIMWISWIVILTTLMSLHAVSNSTQVASYKVSGNHAKNYI